MLQVMILLGISASVGMGLAMFISLSSVLPRVQDVEAPEATIIYSSDGVPLARIFREDRTNVPLKEIPVNLRRATVAIEDKRFYEHPGVDMRSIMRAAFRHVSNGRVTGGASTITQQLARNVYLTQRKTVERKAQELVLAILMERHFTKAKILESYLNRVYYGSGAFGVQAASKVYFGKNVGDLDLAECALLAGLVQKPSGYSPHEDIEAAVGRRNLVLKYMLEQGKIGTEEYAKAREETPAIVPRATGRNAYKAAHFVDYVLRQLRKRYPDDMIFSGGLRVYTTLNYDMQKIAEVALRSGVKRFESSRRVSEGCFVAIEPANGYIRAMVGSVDPHSQYNRCTQGYGRQPGSAFKVFVYTAAFEKLRKTPYSTVVDEAVKYPGAGGRMWRPKNYDNRWHGTVTVKHAVAQSINIPAIKIAEEVGVKRVIEYAQAMGIHSELEPYLSLAIGGIRGVHPLEITSAYGTFANDGVHIEPAAVTRIMNSRGETLEEYAPAGQQVITPRTNEMMDVCLRAVVTQGTGRTAGAVSQARGKTGTTNEDKDAWFIGYVPKKMVAACWVGNDDSRPMRGAYGGKVCAPIWRDFMLKSIPILDKVRQKAEQRANGAKKPVGNTVAKHEKPKAPDKKPPDTGSQQDVTAIDDSATVSVTLCDSSNLLATRNCPSSHSATYQRGSEPTSYCTVHRSDSSTGQGGQATSTRTEGPAVDTNYSTVVLCTESGLLASPGCPNVRKRVPVADVPSQVCRMKHQ